MNRKDLLAGGVIRQVDEEDLIKSSLAKEFRRQSLDVVRGGNQEYRSVSLLHPGQQRSKHPLRKAAIGRMRRGGGKSLLDLVDPKDDRSHHFRLAESITQSPL